MLVSEVMLQQTPVSRVLPVYHSWLTRWPTARALSNASPGQALRMWGRLGYPVRALRLHAAAVIIEQIHDGQVPAEHDQLRALPGVGDYTAAAVIAFAYQRRTVVLDTNVRRVFSRVFTGAASPPRAITAGERELAERVLPDDEGAAAAWSVAAMELGAVVCTARAPHCTACPVSGLCAWRQRGYPASATRPRTQSYAGSDRQCRGRILAVLRDSDVPVSPHLVEAAWRDETQRQRALRSLLDDGLVEQTDDGALALPDETALTRRRRRQLVGGRASSTGGESGSSDLAVPEKVNWASAPSPSTSTKTI